MHTNLQSKFVLNKTPANRTGVQLCVASVILYILTFAHHKKIIIVKDINNCPAQI